MIIKTFPIFLLILLPFFLSQCNARKNVEVFTIQDQINLGKLMRDEIIRDNPSFIILKENDYPQSYLYIRTIINTILANNELAYEDSFSWNFYIIKDDNNLQAFATTGGYIFIYSGLLKYLQTEDQLAAVLAQTITHADNQHLSNAMSKAYSDAILINVVAGNNPELLTELIKQSAGNATLNLLFSEADETAACENSVVYLSKTQYKCGALADFFEKIKTDGKCKATKWESTHPNTCDKITLIKNKATGLQCKSTLIGSNYQSFINTLP